MVLVSAQGDLLRSKGRVTPFRFFDRMSLKRNMELAKTVDSPGSIVIVNAEEKS